MDNNQNQWFEFMDLAHKILLKGQSIDNYKQHIQLLFEPSFSNSFHLQLEINEKEIKWFRTSWLRLEDAPKFYNPIEKLKQIGKEIKPTILYENGTTKLNYMIPVLDFVEKISIKPRIEKYGGIILDGINFIITIGVENIQSTYKWHYLPEEWQELEILANMLIELNEKL